MNILLVEDEAHVADFIQKGLKAEAWIVVHAADGETALEMMAGEAFDIVILDLMLPGISGQDVCRKMRARKNLTPVLMLTALDEVDETVEGLRLGADDYLAKPFDFDELIARIEALARRADGFRNDNATSILSCGPIALDTRSLVVSVAERPVSLTAKERDILKLLLLNADRAIPRERILNSVWRTQKDPLTNIVDVYVGRLRKKLGDAGQMLETIRGTGYRLASRTE